MRAMILPILLAAPLAIAGCAENYAAEGAGFGAIGGMGIAAIADGDIGKGATIGAAAGALGGALIKKNGRCYRRDSRGREYRVRCR